MISIKEIIKRVIDEYLYLVIIQIALFIASSIDFIVHDTLYYYGLIFSYNWAIPYWIALFLLFLIFGLLGAISYNIDRENVSKVKLALIVITIIGEYIGGILDTIVFSTQVILRNTPNPQDIVWWWSPYKYIFGTWNLITNVILNVIIIVILGVAWNYILNKKD